jgi:DNA-binding CsgD family transcriptional regulator
MPFSESGWTKARTELLMDITATLTEYTQQPEDFRHIPGYLSGTLRLESISLAVIHEVKDGAHVVLGATSCVESSGTLEQDLLTLHEQTRPLSAGDGAALRSTSEVDLADVTEVPVQFQAEFPRATVFAQSLEGGHRMLLVVHQKAHAPHLSAPISELLQGVARQLGKLMSCLLAWMSQPETLGAPFDRLTDREWMVLRGLNSECGEKQLADQLGLSPHTLHSHIKSIYRKVGVQGRLPLLLRAQQAIRTLRIRKMNGHCPATEESANKRTALAV